MTIIIYNYNELLEKDGEYQSEFLQVFQINLVILSNKTYSAINKMS